MRLLVVEDEIKTREYLRKGLTEEGFIVDTAATGVDGLHLATTGDYELVILDIMLPGVSGWQVLAALRRQKQTPVLFLTARDEVADRVRGLELGADDYLVKPFAFAELVARMRTVMRRGAGREPDVLQMADLELNLRRCRARRGQKRIDLTKKEFALLALLMQRHGDVLSRAYIASQVWDINFHTDTNVVDVAIRRLRAKVDDPYERKLIHTLRGMGYVLEEQERHG
ncbi:MAG: heavy metal response regulator transcription factor [Betaproteobacteria bacterium]|nr:heavy metal response regulator transcription factor [Betaproteobacteria bacterium]